MIPEPGVPPDDQTLLPRADGQWEGNRTLPLVMCAKCRAMAPAASIEEADAWLDNHDCPGVAW